MKRAPLFRRAGGVLLLLAWAQVATANALPCGLSCLLGKDVVHHQHQGTGEDHAIGHHLTGAKVSAPEYCASLQLLVVTFVPSDFPTPPSVAVAVRQASAPVPLPVLSSTPDFDTPPPRA